MALSVLGSRFSGDFRVDDKQALKAITGCHEWDYIDGIRVRPSIFTKAFTRASLGLGMQSVSGCSDIDALLLTSPIPVYLPKKLNVLTVHDVIPLSHPRLIDRWEIIAKSFGSALDQGLKRADKVICVSETTKHELLKRFKVDEYKIDVIYQTCRYSTVATAQTNIQSPVDQAQDEKHKNIIASLKLGGEPFVLFAGAIEPKKNLLNVLKAVEQNPAIPKLVVAGSFAWSSEQERAMINRLQGRVVHLGFVTDEQLKALQQSAAACVFPSVIEGFGLPALEAIWSGTPCVLSDIAVFRELFPDNAYFVNPYSPGEIGEAIVQATKASDAYKVSMATYVKQRYSMAQFSTSLSSVFR